MQYRKRVRIDGETLEERKANATRLVGQNGVFVVRPDETVAPVEIDDRAQRKPVKGSKRKPPRQRATKELAKGYESAAWLAERRAERVAAWSEREAKEYLKVARYCRTMAKNVLTDEPATTRTAYNIDWVDETVLSEIQGRQPDPARWNQDKQMALDAAMLLLSEKERVVVTMYYGSRMRQRDIAKALGTTFQTIHDYIQRARKKWESLRQQAKNQAKPAT